MITFLKALPLGAFLALIVSLFIGSGGSTGGYLNVHNVDVNLPDYGLVFDFYWSWMLFLAGTFLGFIFMLMMGD